jgi:hypothetical protein
MSPEVALLLIRVAAAVVFFGCIAYLFSKPDASKTLLAIGGAIVSISARWSDIQQSIVGSLPLWPAPWLLGGGMLALVAGLVGVAAPIDASQKRIRKIFRGRPLRCRPAKATELQWLRDYSTSFFGETVTSLDLMRRWREKYSKVFTVLEEVSRSEGATHSTIHGYHCIVPLTIEAAALVGKEQIYGTSILQEHVSPTIKDAAAVYIGGVAAKGRRARAAILADLYARIDDLNDRRIPIYTRPVTEDGLRLVGDYPFVPVDPLLKSDTLKRVYRLELE